MRKMLICCICGQVIMKEGCPDYFGNNPDGAMWKDVDGNIHEGKFNPDDRCCDECDQRYVIPGRLYSYAKQRKEAN